MRSLYIIFFMLLLVLKVNAQEEINLAKCRELALENNKQIGIANYTKEKSQLGVNMYRANFLPKFSATGAYVYSTTEMKRTIEGGYLPTFVPDGSGNLVPNLLPNTGGIPIFKEYAYFPDIPLSLALSGTYMGGVKAEQPIFMGGKILAAYKMSKIGSDIADLNKQLTNTDVLVKTDEAYWLHVKTNELLKSAQKYKDVVTELFRTVQDGHESGMLPRNDVLKVQVKVNEAELQLLQAENGVRLSRMNLCHLIGFPLDSLIILSQSFDETKIEIVHSSDISSRPEYEILNRQMELKDQETKLARSDYLPNIGVVASYNYMHGLKLNDEPLLDKGSFSALVSVNIPIFHWGEGKSKIKTAKIEKEIMDLQKSEINEMLTLELEKALNAYEEAILEVRLTSKSLEQAEENMKVSRDQYEEGMETLANYLEAQAMWQKAYTDMINAKATLKFSETYYQKAAGKLLR